MRAFRLFLRGLSGLRDSSFAPEHSTPPGALCGCLRLCRRGPGLCDSSGASSTVSGILRALTRRAPARYGAAPSGRVVRESRRYRPYLCERTTCGELMRIVSHKTMNHEVAGSSPAERTPKSSTNGRKNTGSQCCHWGPLAPLSSGIAYPPPAVPKNPASLLAKLIQIVLYYHH